MVEGFGMSHTIRCPVCDGSGAVEAWFGTGCLPENLKGLKEKQCPVCLGTGIQTILDPGDWTPSNNPNPHWGIYEWGKGE